MKKDDNEIIVDSSGALYWHKKRYRCALGRAGVNADKKEGDGATPAGCFPIREVLYRADRIRKPKTKLPVRALTESDGWCDDGACAKYNQFICLPHVGSHEKLWRQDEVYDIVVVIGHNDDPPIPGKGSAIFMHIARQGYSATTGCVALVKKDLLEILKTATKDTVLDIRNE